MGKWIRGNRMLLAGSACAAIGLYSESSGILALGGFMIFLWAVD